MIEVQSVSKRYGKQLVLDQLSFRVESGRVTGFLGPNGAGKSTTMRIMIGLDRPTSGTVLIDGQPYERYDQPLRKVGALLDAGSVHPGRTLRNHLLGLARSNGLPEGRVTAVLEQVGLAGVAGKRAKTLSLGMAQRLGVAAALLGEPEVLLFDEPVNGLDPEGIQWIRRLMRQLAGEGRTVLVSSHLLSEMAITAEHLVVIGRGRLLADMPSQEFIARYSGGHIRVRTPEKERLRDLLAARGITVRVGSGGALEVEGSTQEAVGELAAEHRVTVYEISSSMASLEEAFVELTAGSVEYRAQEVS
jgi:ABC-2 type transport system ATP-binding protein